MRPCGPHDLALSSPLHPQPRRITAKLRRGQAWPRLACTAWAAAAPATPCAPYLYLSAQPRLLEYLFSWGRAVFVFLEPHKASQGKPSSGELDWS